MVTLRVLEEDGYTIEEVDRMTGPSLGRPKSATFRTFDIVGLDVLAHVAKNIYEAVPEDEERESYKSEEHTSELQSHSDLVCRLLLEKKKKKLEYRRYEDIFIQ